MAGATLLDVQFGRWSSPAWAKGFALTAACCRWPTDIDAVHAAAAAAIDWSIFAQTARRHRVAGLVHNAVERAELPLPADVAKDIAIEARSIAWQNLAYAHETVRLQRLFDRAAVQVVFLKGTALSQAAYGTLTVKHGRDIDLLVSPAQVSIALDLLQADGYTLGDPAGALNPAQIKALVAHGDQAELARRDGRLRLELHWRLASNRHLVHGIEPFAAPAQTALPGLGTLNVLRPEDEFVYLCVHGAGHSWSRLKWLADLNARLAGLEAQQIAGLYEYAEARGAGLCAGQALLLCHRLFGRVLPVGLHEALTAGRRVTRLAASAAQSMMAMIRATHRHRARRALFATWSGRSGLAAGHDFSLPKCADFSPPRATRSVCHCRALLPSCIHYCAFRYGHGGRCLGPAANGRLKRRNAADRLCSAVFLFRSSISVHDVPGF